MVTKLFKRGEADGVTEFAPVHTAAEPGGGVQPFQLRQVGQEPPATTSDSTSGDAGAVADAADKGADEPTDETPALPEVDVEALQREAFQQGFSDGEKAGSDQATAHFQEAVAAFGQATRELASFKPILRMEAETELVGLALTIARRIVRRELTVDPTTVRALVKSCCDEFERAEIHRLRVHPGDVETVAAYFQENPAPTIHLEADASIPRGGVVFESAQGELDGRIETQLSEIEYGLADR